MIFKQTDFPDLTLGNGGLSVAKEGCLAISCVNALNLAGYNVTPQDFIGKMNANGGFENSELVWGVLPKIYSQINMNGSGYTLAEGNWSGFKHWVLEHNGVTSDPWFGLEHAPAGWVADGTVHNIGIAPLVAPAPAPQPAPTPQPAPVNFNVTVLRTSNVRTAPSISAQITSVIQPGNTFTGVAIVQGSNVGGNSNWVKSSLGHFVFSGNLHY
jgi:hypothetical protein